MRPPPLQFLQKDCQTKIECVACHKPYARSEWTPKQLEKHESSQVTKLVCKACVAEGCTAANPRFFTCTTCGKKERKPHSDFDWRWENLFLINESPVRPRSPNPLVWSVVPSSARRCVCVLGCPQDPKKERKKKWAAPDRSTSCWRVEILRV